MVLATYYGGLNPLRGVRCEALAWFFSEQINVLSKRVKYRTQKAGSPQNRAYFNMDASLSFCRAYKMPSRRLLQAWIVFLIQGKLNEDKAAIIAISTAALDLFSL